MGKAAASLEIWQLLVASTRPGDGNPPSRQGAGEAPTREKTVRNKEKWGVLYPKPRAAVNPRLWMSAWRLGPADQREARTPGARVGRHDPLSMQSQ